MATARPFAYNIGAPITGTEQVGGLAVGTPTDGFSATGLQWWNGPDEDLGYVIAQSVPSNTQPTPVSGVSASVGFFRSSALTDPSFISIANAVAGPSGGGPFASGSAAKTWLNANGYWTSYVGATGSTGATGFIVTIVESGSNVVMSASGSLNINDLTLTASATGPLGGGGIGVNSATWLMGTNGQLIDQYSGFGSTPSNFGSGGGFGASTSTGDVIGVVYNSGPPYLLCVPAGYTTGTQITSSQTFNSQSFTTMGLVAGTYTYAWGSGANADSINVVVGGTGSTGATGATGAGWLFYAATGPLVDPPPTSDGQAIFTDNTDLGVEVTYNPNKSAGVNFLSFNLQDTDGVDYTSQFTTLQNSGGTVSVSQGSNTATYVLGVGMASINGGLGFVAINAAAATQTVNAASPFVFGTPITIAFS